MSMNVYIVGTREVQVIKTGALSKQTTKFDTWQTRTEDTYKILESSDKIQAYKDWVKSVAFFQEFPVYADDDYFHEEDPIGTKMVNEGEDHLLKFEKWLKYCEQEGYTVELTMI